MSGSQLRDSEAKRILENWALRPREALMPGGNWLRAQPPDGVSTGPRLFRAASAEFSPRTQPDGMWLRFHRPDEDAPPTAVSVFAIEVCGSAVNFADKRSRYAPAHTALLVEIRAAWLQTLVALQNSGWRARWRLTQAFDSEPEDDLSLPVRSLRVMYALPNLKDEDHESLYDQLRDAVALEAHEFLVPHSKLGATNAQIRQLVCRALSPHTI